jgi:hypothetical protein
MNTSFSDFKKTLKENGIGLATEHTDVMHDEIKKREQNPNPFPLHVFHPNIKPFIELIHREYDIPRSFIGLSMLTAYSTAIGNSYWIKNKKLGSMPLNVWASIVGMSSSGKSVIMKQIFRPLFDIQQEYSEKWKEETRTVKDYEMQNMVLRKLTFNDIQIPTLIRWVLPDNPKGMLKFSDEILEWINGMNPNNRSEGNEEQFWLKCWDGSAHQITRSGKQEVSLEKMFVNNFGSIQPTVLSKLFQNNRDTTGFIFRFLFALTDGRDKIAVPSIDFDMPEELEKMHYKAINSMYRGLQLWDLEDVRYCIFTPQAITMFDNWRRNKARIINAIDDIHDRNLQGGIYGKITAYVQRISAILHVSDKAYEGIEFMQEEIITHQTMERAIEIGEYFYQSALDTHAMAKEHEYAPADIVRLATLWGMGKSYSQIGEIEWPDVKPESSKKKAERLVKKNLAKYPKLFRAEVKP